MDIFYDYRIVKKIQINSQYSIYRTIRQSDQNSVFVKIINPEISNLQAISWLQNEYQILKNINSKGVVKPYSLEKYKNSFALISEDFAGEYLNSYLDIKKFSLSNFFTIAIEVVKILQNLHQNQIIHKNLRPSSIIVHPETLEVKITDFSIATNLAYETNISSQQLEASDLAYISPEQTGRINLPLDYRTDFYSLGIVFYQMLTGELPFSGQDSLELMHCHLAQRAVSPLQLNPEISETVSSIVMKLIAKNPEDRYQSTYSIKADLVSCQTQYQNQGIIQPFDLGALDKLSQFTIPQRLYGRSSAINEINSSLERVYSSGTSEMFLISGDSGIGKTSLVHQVTQAIVKQKGYFLTGKFEQSKGKIPYGAIIQAFRGLIQQLLTETADSLKIWQEKILSVVGTNGKVITDILPELELIISSQPDIIKLSSKEAENRFNFVFQEFFRVFAHQEHPLILFLDDLQWADSSSLQFLDLLLGNSYSQYLLVIGTYRDNEISSTHPLSQTVDKIKQNILVSNFVLQPLTVEHINQLLVDILHCQESQSLSLARLLFERTGGNPFFVNQLLEALYAEQLLTFNFDKLFWQWEIEEIRSTSIGNYDVLQLVTRNLEKLPYTSQGILKLAACIGNQFDLTTLATVCDQSQAEIAQELANALQFGIIFLLAEQPNPVYKFSHPHLKQAAYSLLEKKKKILTHLKIGIFLLRQTKKEEIESKIFNLVNHLNIGRTLVSKASFIYRLAELNLIAGKKAKTTTAYEVGANYLNLALELLPLSTWEDNYDLSMSIYTEALEVQYLQANFDHAEKLANIVFAQAKTILEQVEVYQIKIHAYIAQNQMQLAIDTGLHVLGLLNISLPDNPNHDSDLKTQLSLNLERESIESLSTLPEMTAPLSIAAMEILTRIVPPTYIVKPQLFPVLVLKMIDLCLEYGNSRNSAYAYAIYGLLLCASGNIDSGYQLGTVALTLQEKFGAKEIQTKVDFIFNNMIRHWKESAINNLDHFLEGIQNSIEVGDIEHACFHATNYCEYLFLVGISLPSVNEKSLQQIDMMQNFNQNFQVNYALIWQQLNLNLQGVGADKKLLIGNRFDESKMLPLWLESNDTMSLFGFYLAKLILCYFFKDYQQAIVNGSKAKQYLDGAVGRISFAVYHFYYSLALLAVYPDQTDNQSTYLEEILSYRRQIKQWATHSPDNHLHKYELVSAEIARVLGNNEQATEHYDNAITEAAKAGYIHEVALAEELTGEFYLSQEKTRIAGFYLTDAFYGYRRWGALGKVQEMSAEYAELLTRIPTQELKTIDANEEKIPIQNNSLATLDLFSVIKASQTISSEIILDSLLSKLMEIVIENAGAQKSILFLYRDSSWIVAASATINPKKQVDLPYVPIAEYLDLPNSIINYIQSTHDTVILDRASKDGMFTQDPYIMEHEPESILGCPMIYQNKLQGIIYLENSLVRGAFTPNKLEILKVLLSQVSISIENARLYKNLENHTSVQKSLKQKEILLKEIHHRVKNNLFIVSSLLELQSGYIEDPEVIKLLKNCQSRINSMALVHKHLYGNSQINKIDFAQYIESLLDNLAYSQGSKERNIDFVLDLDAIELNIETANPCGLIINELVSNALEHGFRDRDRGNIWLSFKHNIENQILLTIQDDGVGFGDDVDLYNSDSLGLELVCTLVEQLDGTIKLDKSNGTKIEIAFQELDYKSRI